MNYLQDNVLASSHLVHNSIDELSRAINAAETTLSNAINAFGQLNYTKFLENVKIWFIFYQFRLLKTCRMLRLKPRLTACRFSKRR